MEHTELRLILLALHHHLRGLPSDPIDLEASAGSSRMATEDVETFTSSEPSGDPTWTTCLRVESIKPTKQ